MKLAIPRIVSNGISEVATHWSALLRALIVPATMLSVFEVAPGRIGTDSWWKFVLLAAEFPVYALYAMSCHRIVLLGDDSLPNRWGVFWTTRETRFLAWFIAVSLLVASVALIIIEAVIVLAPLLDFTAVERLAESAPWAESVVILVLFAPAAYVVSRASLVFPATAVDERRSLAAAWNLSRNNGWRLAIALAIPVLLLSALRYLYNIILGAPEGILPSILVALWFCLVSAIEVTVLSVAYRTLSFAERTDAAA